MERCVLFPMIGLLVLVVILNPLEPAQVLLAKEPMQASWSDLTVTDIGWNIYSPGVGDIIRFTAYVENQGTADTSGWGDVGVRCFIDGVSIDAGFVSNILPGTTVSVDFYWRATAGDHVVRMFADYGDYVPESNEFNNDREEPFHVNSPPYQPGSPTPGDGADEVSTTVDLGWTGGDPDSGDTVTYDVYLEANDSTPDNLVCNDVSAPVCDPGTLAYGTHYYWVVIATDNRGASTTGSTWDFYTVTEPGEFPAISNIRESDDPVNRESCASDTTLPASVTISANVTYSSSAISSVRLYYRSPGGDWVYRTMGVTRDRDAYKCTFGPFDQAGTLTYFVWAENDQGNETSTDTYTVTVRDCEIFSTTFVPEQHGLRFIN